MTGNEDFASLFGEFEKKQGMTSKKEPRTGDKVIGTVVSIQSDNIFIDLGSKTEGIVEREELTDDEGNLTVEVGDSIEIVVSGKDESSGTLMLGSRHARRMHGIDELRQAFDDQHPVEGRVTGTIKGGLEVEMSNLRAFCPASQIDINYVEDLEAFIGERLAFSDHQSRRWPASQPGCLTPGFTRRGTASSGYGNPRPSGSGRCDAGQGQLAQGVRCLYRFGWRGGYDPYQRTRLRPG